MISGWFVRLTLVFVVLAVGAFDGISIAVAHVSVKDDAQSAALAAATAYQQFHTADAALAAVKGELHDGETLVKGSVHAAPNGTVSLQIRRKAQSIVFHMWSTSARWDIVTGTASAAPQPNQ